MSRKTIEKRPNALARKGGVKFHERQNEKEGHFQEKNFFNPTLLLKQVRVRKEKSPPKTKNTRISSAAMPKKKGRRECLDEETESKAKPGPGKGVYHAHEKK